MGSFSIWHWIIVLLVVLIMFGAGKLPQVMGDVAKGIKSFKRNMRDDEEETPKPTGDPAISVGVVAPDNPNYQAPAGSPPPKSPDRQPTANDSVRNSPPDAPSHRAST